MPQKPAGIHWGAAKSQAIGGRIMSAYRPASREATAKRKRANALSMICRRAPLSAWPYRSRGQGEGELKIIRLSDLSLLKNAYGLGFAAQMIAAESWLVCTSRTPATAAK
jgi:hypothetical protein